MWPDPSTADGLVERRGRRPHHTPRIQPVRDGITGRATGLDRGPGDGPDSGVLEELAGAQDGTISRSQRSTVHDGAAAKSGSPRSLATRLRRCLRHVQRAVPRHVARLWAAVLRVGAGRASARTRPTAGRTDGRDRIHVSVPTARTNRQPTGALSSTGPANVAIRTRAPANQPGWRTRCRYHQTARSLEEAIAWLALRSVRSHGGRLRSRRPRRKLVGDGHLCAALRDVAMAAFLTSCSYLLRSSAGTDFRGDFVNGSDA